MSMRFRLAWLIPLLVAPLAAQSALGQLESMTGQKVQRFKGTSSYHGPSQPTSEQQVARMMGGLFGQLLTEVFQTPAGPDPAQTARAEALRQASLQREQQALLAWAAAYSERMNQLLTEQRQRRANQNQDSLEGLSTALSDPWNGGGPAAQPSGLAAALSDPAPAVDLRDSRTLTPSLLRGENGALRAANVTVDEVLKRREEAQARLKAMMEENKDLKVLGQRFYELEDQLSRLKAEAARLGSDGRALTRDFDAWGWQVDKAVHNALERGVSLLTGTLVPEGTADGLKTLRKNPKTWNDTLKALSQIHDFADFVTEMGDRYDAGRQAVDWVRSKRNLYKDLDFLATNLQYASKTWKPLSTQWELGKNIVGSGLDVAQELDAWGNMNSAQGDLKLLKVRQQVLQTRLTELVGQLQKSRGTLATQLGVHPEDLIPVIPAQKGLDSFVPGL
jgi:hypothetical protein